MDDARQLCGRPPFAEWLLASAVRSQQDMPQDARPRSSCMAVCIAFILSCSLIFIFMLHGLHIKNLIILASLIALLICILLFCRMPCAADDQHRTEEVPQEQSLPHTINIDIPTGSPIVRNGHSQMPQTSLSQHGSLLLVSPYLSQLGDGVQIYQTSIDVSRNQTQRSVPDLPPTYESAVLSEPPPSYSEAEKKQNCNR